MGIPVIQAPSLILPTFWILGTEIEDIDDLLEHTSREFYCADIHEKEVQIVAIENIAAGVPGNLLCWVELSPVPTVTSAAYWAAIGGGGGALAPIAPLVEVAVPLDAQAHGIILNWVVHSAYARVVVQTPVAAALPNAFWQIQVIFNGKTP